MENASLEGKLLGVRGIENYLRKPYGPGWALTGDAGYLKDPSTGQGIGDALMQSIMLADALDTALQGADWERPSARSIASATKPSCRSIAGRCMRPNCVT